MDTEFTHRPLRLDERSQENPYTTITVQCRGLTDPQGIIYAHPEIAPVARHPVFKNQWAAMDYLDDMGHDVAIHRLDNWSSETVLPWLQFDLYGFFFVAELERIFTGKLREDIRYLATTSNKHRIDQGRRLTTSNRQGFKYFNWVEMPWVLDLNGNHYRVRLSIYDTCAVHGVAKYQQFCTNAGIQLLYKDNFTSDEKGRMLEMYTQRPEDFDSYALGDLYNHEALVENSKKFEFIYESLGIKELYTKPKLTIGATVARMVKAAINKQFNNYDFLNVNNYVNKYCKYATADWLKRKSTRTAALNAKVDGGRCRNNRPTDTTASGTLCDIDISGCYGEGLRSQLYPLGRPVLIDYPLDSDINNYDTLKKFIERYGNELVPGLWQLRVSTKPGYRLKYSQDFLASWEPPKDISKTVTDTENADTDYWWDNDNLGEVKIYNNEVKYAVITHDILQIIQNVASVRQRKELLENLYVVTALYYPKSERVYSVEGLKLAHEEHQGQNTTKAVKGKRGNTKKVAIEEECHKWFGVNLGELLVTKLLIERKKYPKKDPLNILYKLCINTVYGDMVSPYFDVGNVVVGNNITARARMLAWCMEKGLHGWQAITDGCTFDVNRVVYPRGGKRVTCEWTDLYRRHQGDYFKLEPIGSCDRIDLSVTLNLEAEKEEDEKYKTGLILHKDGETKLLSTVESLDWINTKAIEHLRFLFPGLDILHQSTIDVKGNERVGQFEFEAKGFFERAAFHGTANYCLGVGESYKFAMRSYSKRQHRIIHRVPKDIELFETVGKPSELFLLGLFNPTRIARADVFLKQRIMKVGDYRKNYGKWKESNVFPGATIEVASLLREFSLSQFTFQTREQYLSWKREFTSLMRKYKHSYEMFFLNKDSTLNYQLMIETIDEKIRDGKANFFDGIDKRERNAYRMYLNHRNKDTLETIQRRLNEYYVSHELESVSNEEWLAERESEFLEEYLSTGDFIGTSWDD
jgi:hypothetical protein